MKLPKWLKDTPENRKWFDEVHSHVRKEIVQEVDGFYYFHPKAYSGYLSQRDLKFIVFILEQLNKPWEDYLNEELD